MIKQIKVFKKSLIMVILLILSISLIACDDSEITSEETQLQTSYIEDNEEFMGDLNEIIDEMGEMDSIYNVSVSYNGDMLNETHFNNAQEGLGYNVFSVTKSVMSLLIGIAIDYDFIGSVEETIADYIDLSEYDVEPEVSSITIHNLMTMSAGLHWDSNDLASEMINLRSTSTPLENILEREMDFIPGTRFNYSDGSAHLMSVILAEATGMSAYDFANEYLFHPLGITNTAWRLDSKGYNIGGCDLHLSSSDMSKIGNLVLNEGIYDGNIIVSKEWLVTSTTDKVSSFVSFDYGYYWWLSTKAGYDLISARGWGGQQIYIVPEFNLVVTTSSNGMISDENASSNFGYLENIVVNRVIDLFIEELK
jgi:CubicO group peptidase (beta-lactamase class C family)